MNNIARIPRHLVVRFQSHFADERGASMVEYALLIALIAMVAIAAVALVGSALDTKYTGIASSVTSAGT